MAKESDIYIYISNRQRETDAPIISLKKTNLKKKREKKRCFKSLDRNPV